MKIKIECTLWRRIHSNSIARATGASVPGGNSGIPDVVRRENSSSGYKHVLVKRENCKWFPKRAERDAGCVIVVAFSLIFIQCPRSSVYPRSYLSVWSGSVSKVTKITHNTQRPRSRDKRYSHFCLLAGPLSTSIHSPERPRFAPEVE